MEALGEFAAISADRSNEPLERLFGELAGK